MTAFRGLTWDHPRGHAPLAAAAERWAGEIEITWDAQPLEGFESTPIPELARSYDLIVLDHPHLGEAVAADCLVPVADLLGDDAVARIAAATVGAAAASYDYDGRSYALPLDAATQVQVLHPGLTGDRPAPETWAEVRALADEQPVALSLAGPHALLTFCSIAAGLGASPFEPGDSRLAAFAILEELRGVLAARRCATRIRSSCSRPWRVSARPLLPARLRLRQLRASRRRARGPALRRRARARLDARRHGHRAHAPLPARAGLAEHLAWLLDPATQTTFIPEHEGQPAARAAWTDPALDASSGGFYSGTLRTTEAAWVRPRFPGYIEFQSRGSELIRDGLAERIPGPRLLDRLDALWRASLPTGAVL